MGTPPEAEGTDRQRRRRQRRKLLGALVVVAALLVVVIVATSGGGSNGGNPSDIVGVSAVQNSVQGVSQNQLVLGDAKAQVKIQWFGDLQCPYCHEFAEQQLPAVIQQLVRAGKAKLVFENLPILGKESVVAGEAAVAAGTQQRGWQFIQLFYRNQGEEKSGYVTSKFLRALALVAGVPNLVAWEQESRSSHAAAAVALTAAEAKEHKVTETPVFIVTGPRGQRTIANNQTAQVLAHAVEEVSAKR